MIRVRNKATLSITVALPQDLPQVLRLAKTFIGNVHQHLLAPFFVFTLRPSLLVPLFHHDRGGGGGRRGRGGGRGEKESVQLHQLEHVDGSLSVGRAGGNG